MVEFVNFSEIVPTSYYVCLLSLGVVSCLLDIIKAVNKISYLKW